jgi:hypothetical protein
MKIVVTYEAADISRLIKQDLARQGITATDADIKYSKGNAVVSVEVDPDDAPTPGPVESVPMTTAPVQHAPVSPPPAPPRLEAIEGGASPVDMSAVFRESQKLAATTEGKFPSPKQHAMLDGESYEFPGSPGDDR